MFPSPSIAFGGTDGVVCREERGLLVWFIHWFEGNVGTCTVHRMSQKKGHYGRMLYSSHRWNEKYGTNENNTDFRVMADSEVKGVSNCTFFLINDDLLSFSKQCMYKKNI